MDRIDLALLLARRATLIEARSAEPDAPVVPVRAVRLVRVLAWARRVGPNR